MKIIVCELFQLRRMNKKIDMDTSKGESKGEKQVSQDWFDRINAASKTNGFVFVEDKKATKELSASIDKKRVDAIKKAEEAVSSKSEGENLIASLLKEGVGSLLEKKSLEPKTDTLDAGK